jgi:hypothetical protein
MLSYHDLYRYHHILLHEDLQIRHQLEGWFVKNRFLGIDFNVCFLMFVKVKCSIIKGTSNNTVCSIH